MAQLVSDMDKAEKLERFDALMHESMKQVGRLFVPKPDGKQPYLERLILNENTYLHIIWASDEDRDPHDHPFDFTSTIIHGSYSETTFDRACELCDLAIYEDRKVCHRCGRPVSYRIAYRSRLFRAGEQNQKEAPELHKLTLIGGPVVTLVTRGAKTREWGFQTPNGWFHHRDYLTLNFPKAASTE